MADNKISVEFEVVSNAAKKIDEIANSVSGLEKTLQNGLGKASAAFSVFQGVLGERAVEKSLELIAEAAHKAFDVFVTEGIEAAQKEQDALNKLNQALAQSGNYSEQASKKFEEFAQAMERSTKFSSDAVLSAGALLASLTGLSGEGLERATRAAIDFSAATGKDLDSAIFAIAKSANGSTEAFAKLGVKFKEGASNAETLNNAVAALESRFGGSAASQAKTFSGAVTILEASFEDLQKVVGRSVIENVAVVNVLTELSKIFFGTADGAKNNEKALREFVAQGVIYAIDAIEVFINVLDVLYRAGSLVFNGLKGAASALALGVTVVIAAIAESVTSVIQLIPGVGDKVKEVISKIEGAAVSLSQAVNDSAKGIEDALGGTTSAFKAVDDKLAMVKQSAEAGFDAVKNGAIASVEPINKAKVATQELTKAQQELIDKGVKLAQQEAEKDPTLKYQADVAALQAANEAKKINDLEYLIAKEQLDADYQAKKDEAAQNEAQKLIEYNNQLLQIDADGNAALIAQNQAKLAAIQQQEGISAQARAKIQSQILEDEKKKSQQRAENFRSTLSYISTLQQNATGDLFRVGQAAAIATATIDGIAAVQKALASAPPPFNFALAALVGVAAAANVNKIASQSPPKFAKGIDSIPGTGNQDNFPALLAPGERVVPRKSNEDLTAFLAGGGNADILRSIDDKLGRLENQIVVNIGGKEIVNEIRDALRSGRSIA